jgi:hypothetical protein
MNDPSPATAISPLRQRLIDDRNVRRFSRETQRNYIRDDRDDDTVTRHGSNLHCVAALSHRPSTPHAPGDALAPSITPIPHVIADLAHTRHWSRALFGRQDCRSEGPGQPGEHHAGNPHHTQFLKSP